MPEWDVAVVGAGAAGLSLAHRLAGHAPGLRTPSVVLVDAPPGPLRPPPRTWCHWAAGPGRFDAAVSAEWGRLRVRPRSGAPGGGVVGGTVERDIAPLRYRMIRSDDFERLVLGDLAGSPNVRRLEATVETVRDVPGGAHVHLRDTDGRARVLSARWVFDSRPTGSLPAARTLLLQHFHGWFVRTARPVFDPDAVELMDFRTPQPAHGLSFGYVLPLGPREALVEYTEFSARTLAPDAYEAAVRHYADEVLRLGERRIVATETGVIPMTDAPIPRQVGASVFRIGAAGGATRPATGYTFAGVQRQTRAVADALRRGRRPLPPPVHSARSRAMDAVLLRALDSGRADGPELFSRLFARVPVARLLRFLDGDTRLHEDLSIGLRLPAGPMLRSALELPRLPRRPRDLPTAPRPSAHPAAPPRPVADPAVSPPGATEPAAPPRPPADQGVPPASETPPVPPSSGPAPTAPPSHGPVPTAPSSSGPAATVPPSSGPAPTVPRSSGSAPTAPPSSGPAPTAPPSSGTPPVPPSSGSAATVPPSCGPAPTAPPSSGPTPTAPPSHGPAPTAPPSSGPAATVPPSFDPAPTVPRSSGSAPTAPPSSGPAPTAPPSHGPAPTAPPSSGPAPTAPPSTEPPPPPTETV